MKPYALMNSGKVKSVGTKKIKKSKVNSYFITMHSELYGDLYMRVPHVAYKKLNKIEQVKCSYSFVDGTLLDSITEEEIEMMTVRNRYTYRSYTGILSKLFEIYVSENILNSLFWVFDCYPTYFFKDFKIKVKLTGKEKPVRMKYVDKFDDYFKIYKNLRTPRFLDIDFDSGKFREADNLKDIKNKSDEIFVQIYNNVYIKANTKQFKKIDSVKLRTKVQIYDTTYEKPEYCTYNDMCEEVTFPRAICRLFEKYLSSEVCSHLDSAQIFDVKWRLKNRLLAINGESIPKRDGKRFDQFMQSVFPDIIKFK